MHRSAAFPGRITPLQEAVEFCRIAAGYSDEVINSDAFLTIYICKVVDHYKDNTVSGTRGSITC